MRKSIIETATCQEKTRRNRKKAQVDNLVSDQLYDYENQVNNQMYQSKMSITHSLHSLQVCLIMFYSQVENF